MVSVSERDEERDEVDCRRVEAWGEAPRRSGFCSFYREMLCPPSPASRWFAMDGMPFRRRPRRDAGNLALLPSRERQKRFWNGLRKIFQPSRRQILSGCEKGKSGLRCPKRFDSCKELRFKERTLAGKKATQRTLRARRRFGGWISIRGAREHNLRDVSVQIPRDAFVVVTGVSGSGKSTLAFDLLYAEGQRRFLDSTSAYARQFVQQRPRPDVDWIEGLPPTVSIEQRNTRGGGKSTVGTVTEIYQFVRLLYARLGAQFCPDCDLPVEPQTRDQLAEILARESARRGALSIFAPLVRHRKGFHSALADWAKARGFQRLRADGRLYRVDQPFRLDRFREHDVEVEVGLVRTRRIRPQALSSQVREIVDRAIQIGKGVLYAVDGKGRQSIHSTLRVCPGCRRSFDALDPKDFSYNSSKGWCKTCRGFGEVFSMPEVADPSGRDEAAEDSWFHWQEGKRELCPACRGSRLHPAARSVYLRWDKARKKTRSERWKKSAQEETKAPGQSVDSIARMTVQEAARYFDGIRPSERESEILRDILPEIRERLRFLSEVGLGYLQLGRGVPTLSGGENQRIRLAAQLGSNLSGVLYVLDEPTIGLHARDNDQLLQTLKRLQARGNSLVVVEHDEDTIRHADFVVDLGPGAGTEGGKVVWAGSMRDLARLPPQTLSNSVTVQCLQARKNFPLRGERRRVRLPSRASNRRTSAAEEEPRLLLLGAAANNLKQLDLSIPLERFVVVSGVSGSGKSTLARECLLPAVARLTGQCVPNAASAGRRPPVVDPKAEQCRAKVENCVNLGKVFEIDQSPIGRTTRSVPATYVGFFDAVRKIFSQLPAARALGYGPGRFSFNNKGGQCAECKGAGELKLEMAFLPPAYIHCEHCGGSRYSAETLNVRYRGKHIGEVLELSIAEAAEFFGRFPLVKRALDALLETGLGYLRLGQPSPTLSGGEAQRVKLVTHLLGGMKLGLPAAAPLAESSSENAESILPPADKPERKGTRRRHIYLLEEPTIGLHIADVHRLLLVLQRLVDQGHSVIVIEHNLDVIAEADWVIDLGPEGGVAGGRIVAQGPPEKIARNRRSHTGRFLNAFLQSRKNS